MMSTQDIIKKIFDVSSEADRQIISWHIDHKCQEEGCRNYAEKGLVYCATHMYGQPRRIDDVWFELYEKMKLLEDI